jgi:hypothetical protein
MEVYLTFSLLLLLIYLFIPLGLASPVKEVLAKRAKRQFKSER